MDIISNKFLLIITILGCLLFIYLNNALNCTENTEHMNEGSFKHLYPLVNTNFDSNLYPKCEKDIRNNGHNERYCNDSPSYQKHFEYLYNGNNDKFIKGKTEWMQYRYPSYFYPQYSTNLYPHTIYSPDYEHRQLSQ